MIFADLEKDVIYPVLLCLIIGTAGIFGAVYSRRYKKVLKKTARYAVGEIRGYRSYLKRHGRFIERYRDITAVCTPPDSDTPERYIITTQGHFTFRYRWVKQVRLTFPEKGAPLLPEDVAQLKFDSIAGLIAGSMFLLMALCVVIGHILGR
ncbi:hypothetical protein [Ruminococcus albus]|uniref:DUF3592 domain-containing protein n=1 Tax=Ruminococcus albus TaxID=1264 RepID=A0A1H7JM45_RUMAL|nr:hypothetical protein [Ruminococcus albus]SEK75713.1 hypothetical protein SAMN05216469_105129 [Ruminococcus albus]